MIVDATCAHTAEHKVPPECKCPERRLGEATADVEFGAKLNLSIVDGPGCIEKISFEAYNESEVLQDVIERYYQREDHYPERILADKIYRNRANLQYCKSKGIRLLGPSLGIPKQDPSVDKRTEYIYNADRVEVERAFKPFEAELWHGADQDQARRNHAEFHCALNHCDEHRQTGKSLFMPKNSSGIFKVQLRNKDRDSAVYSA